MVPIGKAFLSQTMTTEVEVILRAAVVAKATLQAVVVVKQAVLRRRAPSMRFRT